jgi:hypothetical protein
MEIKNIKHLMLNEYPQEFVDSTTYQGTVITPYVRGISEKFRCIANHFSVRAIFKTKHTRHGILKKTGPGKRRLADEAMYVQYPT